MVISEPYERLFHRKAERLDFDDDDILLEQLIDAGENLCMDIARMDDKGVLIENSEVELGSFALLFEFDGDQKHNRC